MGETAFSEGSWQSSDGLALHYRDYAGRSDRPPILCIPGLTRNARDFEPVADRFAGDWRVICVDLRGRGMSEYAKDSATYTPAHYAEDISALFEQAELKQVVAIGTSLGGIVTTLMAAQDASRFAGVVLNDIGPDIEEEGMARIRDYVGQGRNFPTWVHAARHLSETMAMAYPDFDLSDWLRIAKRMMALSGGGRIAFDYDMRISEPLTGSPVEQYDTWSLFKRLAGRPVLALHGELSDILSINTLRRMDSELADCVAVTVPRVGHAPTLEEPVAHEAIAHLLSKIG